MIKRILIKPVITEKSELLSSSNNQYSFVVDKKANKIEIKKAIENKYGVTVESVSTMIVPGKSKTRATRSGYVKGRTSSFKKAIISVAEGEELNIYGEV
ncbi:MAG TPA: 50S ribosomal protein L23 [Saprospiraceae bacterium]|nr:50S ribosomal protein L23 [Saprospiraceae bacterium]